MDGLADLSRSASGQHRGAASLYRRAPLPKPWRRFEPGLLRRRHHGGSDQRSVATRWKLRDLPEYRVHVQGPDRRYPANRPRVGRPVCARWKRTQDGRHSPRQRAAHRRGYRRESLGRSDRCRSNHAGGRPGQLRHLEPTCQDAQCRARQCRGPPGASRQPRRHGPHDAGLVHPQRRAKPGRRGEGGRAVRGRPSNRSRERSGSSRTRPGPRARPPEPLGSRVCQGAGSCRRGRHASHRRRAQLCPGSLRESRGARTIEPVRRGACDLRQGYRSRSQPCGGTRWSSPELDLDRSGSGGRRTGREGDTSESARSRPLCLVLRPLPRVHASGARRLGHRLVPQVDCDR